MGEMQKQKMGHFQRSWPRGTAPDFPEFESVFMSPDLDSSMNLGARFARLT